MGVLADRIDQPELYFNTPRLPWEYIKTHGSNKRFNSEKQAIAWNYGHVYIDIVRGIMLVH